MHVYLVFKDKFKRTPDVTMDLQKCTAQVGTYKEVRINPAQWFKVQVMGSILVDCEQKEVFWTCEENDQLLDMSINDLLAYFQQRDCLTTEWSHQSLDPTFDELFEVANNLFYQLYIAESADNEATVSDQLMKLLQLYLLPQVHFLPKHQTVIQDLHSQIAKEIAIIETRIESQVQKKKTHEEKLTSLRKCFFRQQDFSRILHAEEADREFLKYLSKHNERDIANMERHLLFKCDKAHFGSTSTIYENEQTLKLAEVDDIEIRKSVQVLILQQINTLAKMDKSKSTKSCFAFLTTLGPEVSLDIHDKISEYVDESQKLDQSIEAIGEQMNIKLKLSSIRELIWLTCNEIEKKGFSFGHYLINAPTETNSCMSDITEKPDHWISLRDQVIAKLETPSLKAKHVVLCSRLKSRCRELLRRSCEGSDPTMANGNCITGSDAGDAAGSMAEEGNCTSLTTKMVATMRQECEAICQEVREHTEGMAQVLEEQLTKSSDTDEDDFYKRVYICYEEQLSEEIMQLLCQIYEQTFQAACTNLSSWIQEHAKSEVEIIEETMSKLFPNTGDKAKASVYAKRLTVYDFTRSHIGALVDSMLMRTGSLVESFEKAWESMESVFLEETRSSEAEIKPDSKKEMPNASELARQQGDYNLVNKSENPNEGKLEKSQPEVEMGGAGAETSGSSELSVKENGEKDNSNKLTEQKTGESQDICDTENKQMEVVKLTSEMTGAVLKVLPDEEKETQVLNEEPEGQQHNMVHNIMTEEPESQKHVQRQTRAKSEGSALNKHTPMDTSRISENFSEKYNKEDTERLSKQSLTGADEVKETNEKTDNTENVEDGEKIREESNKTEKTEKEVHDDTINKDKQLVTNEKDNSKDIKDLSEDTERVIDTEIKDQLRKESKCRKKRLDFKKESNSRPKGKVDEKEETKNINRETTTETKQQKQNTELHEDVSRWTPHREKVIKQRVQLRKPKDVQVKEAFTGFFQMLQEESRTLSLFGKLQKLSNAARLIAKKVNEICERKGVSFVMCADDFLDICVLLLCEMDTRHLVKLYAHINLLYQIIPIFLQGSMYEHALVTMLGAFQHLFEKKSMHDKSI